MSRGGARPEDDTGASAGAREQIARRRSYVLRGSAEFEAVLRTGCRMTSANFILRAAPNLLTHARLGIIAGRKTAPRAVDRNRAKRLIREAFRERAPQLGAHDLAIQLRDDLRGAPNAAVREELAKLLSAFARRLGTNASDGRNRQ